MSGNTEVCLNLVSDVTINSRGRVLSPTIYNSVKTMIWVTSIKKKVFLITVNM